MCVRVDDPLEIDNENSEIYMDYASETDVDGIPCGCLEKCKTVTRHMLTEANVRVLL